MTLNETDERQEILFGFDKSFSPVIPKSGIFCFAAKEVSKTYPLRKIGAKSRFTSQMRHDTLRRRHQSVFKAFQKFRQSTGVVIKACEVAANAQILVHHTKNKPPRSLTVIAGCKN